MLRTYTNRVSQYYQQRDEAVDQLGQPVSGCALPKILLIVEDEVNIANTYHRVFSRQGLEVLTALSTAEARDLLAKERVDIVVMDINMPEIDGAVLFQAIKAFHKNVKVLVSSVYSIDEQKERIKEADGYFDKSDSNDVLVDMVTGLLKSC